MCIVTTKVSLKYDECRINFEQKEFFDCVSPLSRVRCGWYYITHSYQNAWQHSGLLTKRLPSNTRNHLFGNWTYYFNSESSPIILLFCVWRDQVKPTAYCDKRLIRTPTRCSDWTWTPKIVLVFRNPGMNICWRALPEDSHIGVER